jgi:hypothetical protein
MTNKSKTPSDFVFVVAGTLSTPFVLQILKEEIVEWAFDVRVFRRDLNLQCGVVIYRDPVDDPNNPEDINEFFQLTSDFESVEHYLADVRRCGGRDSPEDWVGGLSLALNEMNWRDGKKCIFWITDENAHGSRFSLARYDKHDDQAELLPPLIERAAKEQIYFVVMNLRGFCDPGCEKTAGILKEIYLEAGGPSFAIVDFNCSGDSNEWMGGKWGLEVVEAFGETIKRTLKSEECGSPLTADVAARRVQLSQNT